MGRRQLVYRGRSRRGPDPAVGHGPIRRAARGRRGEGSSPGQRPPGPRPGHRGCPRHRPPAGPRTVPDLAQQRFSSARRAADSAELDDPHQHHDLNSPRAAFGRPLTVPAPRRRPKTPGRLLPAAGRSPRAGSAGLPLADAGTAYPRGHHPSPGRCPFLSSSTVRRRAARVEMGCARYEGSPDITSLGAGCGADRSADEC